jgi:hypothetical protein
MSMGIHCLAYSACACPGLAIIKLDYSSAVKENIYSPSSEVRKTMRILPIISLSVF